MEKFEPVKETKKLKGKNQYINLFYCAVCGNHVTHYKDMYRCRWCRNLIEWRINNG